MHRFGISVYPDKTPFEEVYAYIEKAAKLGYKRIFTCFLSIPNDKRSAYLVEFQKFMEKAHQLGFEVTADTNPSVFHQIGATPDNLKPFADLGLDVLRMDGNFGTQGDILLTRNPYHIKIEFNASMDMGIELLIKSGANKEQITMCHNFYPERYTGLDFELFQTYNRLWKKLNLPTAAFVSSNNTHTIGPWKVFCGLPTVEILRTLPIDLQARYLLATGNVDDILIGNYPTSDQELRSLSQIDSQVLEVRVNEVANLTSTEKKILYDFAPHSDRYDHSSFMLRSSMPRVWLKDQETQSIPYRNPQKDIFSRGDVLIVNDNLAHYRGELEIVLTEIPNDGERNLVAQIRPEEIPLLDFIRPGHYFKLRS